MSRYSKKYLLPPAERIFSSYNSIIMSYKTYERDRDGKVSIYPSLHDPTEQSFFRRLLSILKRYGSIRGILGKKDMAESSTKR